MPYHSVIHTGIRYLDESLDCRMLVDISGPAGSGKTGMLHRIAAAAYGGVAYIDAVGSFRPERILDMGAPAECLDTIKVLRPISVAEQMAAAQRVDSDVEVLLVDGVTDLFMYEYAGINRAFERSRYLMQHMRTLAGVSRDGDIPVVITNTMRYDGGRELESMGRTIWLYPHARIHLSGGPRYMATYSTAHHTESFHYAPRTL